MKPWTKAILTSLGIIAGGVVIIGVVELVTFASVASKTTDHVFHLMEDAKAPDNACAFLAFNRRQVECGPEQVMQEKYGFDSNMYIVPHCCPAAP